MTVSAEEKRRLRRIQRQEFIELVARQQEADRRLTELDRSIERTRSQRLGTMERSVLLTQLEQAHRATAAEFATTRARVQALAAELKL